MKFLKYLMMFLLFILIDIEKGDIVLDGITIQRGTANVSSNASDRKASGAGIFYTSRGKKSSL